MEDWEIGEIEKRVQMYGEQVRGLTDEQEIRRDTKRRWDMFPVELEEPIPTLDTPLIIESAYPGWQPRYWGPKEMYGTTVPKYYTKEGDLRFPAVPCSIEEQVKVISESIKAGAVAVHIHPRHPRLCTMQINPKLLAVIMDGVFDKVGDCVTLNHSWMPVFGGAVDYIIDTEEALELGKGNKYVQGTVVLPIAGMFTHDKTAEGLQWLEANDVKPIYQCYDTYSHWHFKRLIDEGASSWKPFVMNLHLGKHSAHTIHQDPESFQSLIANFHMVKKTFPGSRVGVFPGGRNWIPTMIMGIMLGADLIRVGIEDCYWMWPHKDDLIKNNVDTVKIAVEIANILGRRVVTDANEARQILGMKLTSKL